MKHLILASGSPRRRELLSLFGIPFTVHAADIDETMDPAKPPCDEVARVSACKALAIARQPGDVVIAADTIVVCEGKVLGKPHSREDAIRMLHLLSGREHQVMTGCTVLTDDARETFTEPMDKAGAYGIQGGAALFCPGIRGDYYNVMGLPVCHLGTILRSFGIWEG